MTQEARLINLGELKNCKFKLSFPSIGNYVMRVHAKIVGLREEVVGIETVKNVAVQVD